MENLLFLGVPILKHIRVVTCYLLYIRKSLDMNDNYGTDYNMIFSLVSSDARDAIDFYWQKKAGIIICWRSILCSGKYV